MICLSFLNLFKLCIWELWIFHLFDVGNFGFLENCILDFVKYQLFKQIPAITYGLLWISQSSPTIIRSSGVRLGDKIGDFENSVGKS